MALCCGLDQATQVRAQSGFAGLQVAKLVGSAAGGVDGVGGCVCAHGIRLDRTEGLQQGKPSPVEMQLQIPTALLS